MMTFRKDLADFKLHLLRHILRQSAKAREGAVLGARASRVLAEKG
jgi:hypothetical protein